MTDLHQELTSTITKFLGKVLALICRQLDIIYGHRIMVSVGKTILFPGPAWKIDIQQRKVLFFEIHILKNRKLNESVFHEFHESFLSATFYFMKKPIF